MKNSFDSEIQWQKDMNHSKLNYTILLMTWQIFEWIEFFSLKTNKSYVNRAMKNDSWHNVRTSDMYTALNNKVSHQKRYKKNLVNWSSLNTHLPLTQTGNNLQFYYLWKRNGTDIFTFYITHYSLFRSIKMCAILS